MPKHTDWNTIYAPLHSMTPDTDAIAKSSTHHPNRLRRADSNTSSRLISAPS